MEIAIINDIPEVLEGLKQMVFHEGKHQLIWAAWNGADGLRLCQQNTPDLILIGLLSAGNNCKEVVHQIMLTCPCPILIVAESISEHSGLIFSAMGAGAIDVIKTPSLKCDKSDDSYQQFIRKIAMISSLTQKIVYPENNIISKDLAPGRFPAENHLVVIGCSSGGPEALPRIFSELPANYHSSIVVIQHVDAKFAPSLARWLNEKSNLPVELIESGDFPKPGHILLANTNDHLIMTEAGHLAYINKPMEVNYRPSVDVFFNSVAKNWNHAVTAVLLTGMGRDGAEGMLSLRKCGAYTIAQDEKTAAVYGMPKVAKEINAAVEIVHLEEIYKHIINNGTISWCENQRTEYTGSTDLGLEDNGLEDSGLTDSGLIDSGLTDSGLKSNDSESKAPKSKSEKLLLQSVDASNDSC